MRLSLPVKATTGLATIALAVSFAVTPAVTASATAPANQKPVGPPTVKTVTLVTGDVVEVSTSTDGRSSVVIQPRPDGTIPQAAISQVHDHLYVVPCEALGLLAARSLDQDLFDVTGLIDAKYDDAARPTLPVMVDYGTGHVAGSEARTASFAAADRTVTIPELGIAAFNTDKSDARAFWDSLTKGSDDAGNPTALTDGANRVNLDGRVEMSLEDSVPQIHAPEAWAAGYNGSGSTVAILDTGYDPTHPDLAGRVVKSANFTTDATVTDGNGHGTHVASTVAGSGAASGGLRKGVAPGADLMVGKVLADGGYGEDSWVLAGMAWAVDQGADVVSMSLGGDTDDGSNPLAQAVNQLSADSDTLFVIAAGNNGDNGPSTITAPGSADAALTVGAVDVNDTMASFSSRGPRSINGALKPEVVAPGVDVTAARAAGTELGPIVDDYYTTLSGTSMATPHVAGLAAILKEEHPNWTGERLKSVITNSTVPIDDATAFEAGTGRIDALVAIHQDVIAPATLSLGSYSWPYSDVQPSTTQLKYKNTGNAPVTLSLDLAGEDGTAEPTGSMTLEANQVTVPAHGKASVGVRLDPTIADPGSYSAVVTATPDDGGETVRTGVSYMLEAERYDVTVTIVPRDGTLASHQLSLSGFDDPWVYEQRSFDASADVQTATFRVPPGNYGTAALSFGLAADGAHEGVVTYQPSFTVTHNTNIVLDENDTGRFKYKVDQPVVDEGAILDVVWNGDSGSNGFLLYGSTDRVYARPSSDLPGAATLAASWLLSQPEGLLTQGSGPAVPLRPIPATGGQANETTVPKIEGQYAVVDAGSAASPDTSAVAGAIAVVAGTCTDLTPAADSLKAAGAAAMIAYAGAGQQCAGTIDPSVEIPSLQARPFDSAALLSAPGQDANLVTHQNPAYMYDLIHHFADGIPDGGTVNGTGNSVSSLVEHYRGLGTTSADGLRVLEEPIGWIPSRNGAANVGLERRVSFPSTVTHYMSTGANWERTVEVLDTQFWGEYGRLWSPPTAYDGGSVYHDTWFGGPIGSRVSPLFTTTNGAPPPTREGNDMYFSQGAFTDAAGHMAHSDIFSREYKGKIYAGDKLMLDTSQLPESASYFLNSTVPAHKRDYRVITNTKRDNLFWQLSTQVRTEWWFASEASANPIVLLPMLGIDYRMDLSNTNSATAGKYAFKVKFDMPNGVKTLPIVKHKLKISWNHGESWKVVTPARCGQNACTVEVNNRAGRTASLHVKATDSQGRAVAQTIVDAYNVQDSH